MTKHLDGTDAAVGEARWIAQRLVLLVQAILFAEGGPQSVAETFIASRLGRQGSVFGGALPVAGEGPAEEILARAWTE